MFTGIVEGVGRVAALERRGAGARLVVVAGRLLRGVSRGGSVAVSGVCLTLVRPVRSGRAAFDVVAETLSRTTLGSLRPGDPVNIERALRWGDPLGGHVVWGHVDGTGRVRAVRDRAPRAARGRPPAGGREMTIALPVRMAARLVGKGSVAVDGVSLTVAAAGPASFRVALIPETLRRTTLGLRRSGDRVNLELDRGPAAPAAARPGGVTWALLRRCGFAVRARSRPLRARRGPAR